MRVTPSPRSQLQIHNLAHVRIRPRERRGGVLSLSSVQTRVYHMNKSCGNSLKMTNPARNRSREDTFGLKIRPMRVEMDIGELHRHWHGWSSHLSRGAVQFVLLHCVSLLQSYSASLGVEAAIISCSDHVPSFPPSRGSSSFSADSIFGTKNGGKELHGTHLTINRRLPISSAGGSEFLAQVTSPPWRHRFFFRSACCVLARKPNIFCMLLAYDPFVRGNRP